MPFRTRRRPSARSPYAGRAAIVVVATALLGAACSSTVQVDVAPSATDPMCAQVVLALPDDVAGLARITTTSQATAAWGSPGAAIVLRCGVEPPGPTTDQCVTVTDPAGGSVDWVVTVDGSTDAGAWTFVTFGRVPAVELTVPQVLAGDQPDSLLVDVGRAVSEVPAEHACL